MSIYATYATLENYLQMGGPAVEDGTYRVEFAQGNDQVWENGMTLRRVAPNWGYAIGYDEIIPTPHLQGEKKYYLGEGDLIGAWTDPEDGKLYLDRVVIFDGPRDMALNLGAEHGQKAIYDFSRGVTLSTASVF